MRTYALLVRKDFLAAFSNSPYMIMILVIYLAVMAASPSTIPLMFSIMVFILVLNLFFYEENDLVCNVTGILPIRRGQPVIARYLYMLLVHGLGVVLCTVLNVIVDMVTQRQEPWMPALLIAAATSITLMNVCIPLIYRFNVAKMRIILMIASFALIGAVSALLPTLTSVASALGRYLPATLLAAALLLSFVSLLISIRVERHKH